MTPVRRRAVVGIFSFALLLLCGVPAARADYTMTLNQVGSNVVGTGSGTINLSGLTASFLANGGGLVWGTFAGGSAAGLGAPGVQVQGYTAVFTGSSDTFGSGTLYEASSGTGDPVDISPGSGGLLLPTTYVSGDALSDTSTWDNTTIAALGLTPGTYTYDWGSGATADSFTLVIAPSASATPEPSSLALLGSGVLGMAGVVRRRLR